MTTSPVKRSELGTWYPPGEAQVVMALRLAAKHGGPPQALAAIEKTIGQWEKRPVELDARTLYGWHRTRTILQFWLVSDEGLTRP